MKLEIYSKEGQLKLTVAPESNNAESLGIQEESALALSFTGFACVPLEVYDYAEFLGRRYWVTERYVPKMNARKEWAYSVSLYGVEGLAAQTLMVNPDDGDNPVLTLTAPAREHAALIVANLNRRMETTEWKVGEVVVSEYIDIEYTGKYASDALSELSEAAGTEWWFDGMTLNISRCEFGEPVTLSYGDGLLGGISRTTADGVKFFTRLFPVGSSRNIDPDYYGHARLQLPDGAKYVEQDTRLGIVEHYEQEAFEDIFPRRVGQVGTVRHEEATGDDGEPFTIWYFTDPDIPFDPNQYEIGGLVKRVTFQSGELRGRKVEVNYDAEKKEFEIITQWPYDDDLQLPSEPLIPASGDEYILWNIRMPESYYPAAEQEYKEAVDQFMADNRKDLSVWQAPTDFTVIERRGLDLRPGQRVRLESAEAFPDTGFRETRIVSISRSVVRPGSMTLKMSDVLSTGRISRIESSIASVERLTKQVSSEFPDLIRSWEETPASDTTVYTSRKSEREFLNKRRGGTVEGPTEFRQRVTFGEDLRTSNFISSLFAGKGAGIDQAGNAEFESVRVRSALEVLELLVNRLSAIEGDQVLTESDTIERVEDLGDGCYGLHLRSKWEGYFTAQVENNVLEGIINTLAAGSGECRTSWMRVNSVNAPANYIEVVLYPDEETPAGKNYPPTELMRIARRGNQTDPTRQRCLYLSSTEGRIVRLTGVTKPILDASNYGATLGTLPEFLTAMGLPVIEGQDYVYARGLIVQDIIRIDYQGHPIAEVVDRGLWTEGESYYASALNPSTGRYETSDVWFHGCRYRCAKTGTTSAPAWNSTAWAMVEGNPEFTVSFADTDNIFDPDRFAVTLTVVARLYNMDVTSDILDTDVVWTRYSEDADGVERVASDQAWALRRGGAGKSLDLTAADCDFNGYIPRTLRFTATVTLRDGMGEAAASAAAVFEY